MKLNVINTARVKYGELLQSRIYKQLTGQRNQKLLLFAARNTRSKEKRYLTNILYIVILIDKKKEIDRTGDRKRVTR